MNEPIVYQNGRMVPASQASLAIYDLGFVYGAAVSEMTRTFRHKPFRLEQHVDRLFRSLRYARIDLQLRRSELIRVSEELVAANAKWIDASDELGLIHFVTPGEHAMYAWPAARAVRTEPTICVHTFRLPWGMWADKMRLGAHVVIPPTRQVPPQCVDPKIKCRSRMHYYLADKEARQVDPDAIALLLDLDGNITETNGANFFIASRGSLITPTLRNTLGGVSRSTLIELAARLGIPCTERDIQRIDAVNADEALLSGTPYCLMPVTRLNNIPIGDGRRGPIHARLVSAWSELVGVDIVRQIVDYAAANSSSRGS